MDFLWLVIVGGFVAFAMAWGIGANDVANAFATSVGAKCLTLKQAVLVAAIFEFSGAVFLGKNVTDTVRKKIVDYKKFQSNPDVFMLGMFGALVAASVWLALATRYSLPVSTTHSIVGAIIGFGLVARGASAVGWSDVGFIVLSWIASPAIAGVLGAMMYGLVRQFVLRADNAAERSARFFPIFIFLVAFIMCLFTIWKGLSKFGFNKIEAGPAIGISAAIGVGVTLICWIPAKKLLIDPILEHDAEDLDHPVDAEMNKIKHRQVQSSSALPSEGGGVTDENPTVAGQAVDPGEENQTFMDKVTPSGLTVNVHEGLSEADIERIEKAEKFDPRVEKIFSYLQVATACLDIFAHGANDVANSIAPFAAMVQVHNDLRTGKSTLGKKAEVPIWILVLGGAGMVFGLATYGYNIIRAIGVRLVTMSSTRGYSIELSSALTVIIASRLGIPMSTTHVQVGATLSVGMLESKDLSGVNWKLMAEVFAGWIVTMLVTGLTSAAIFSFMAYSPKDF